MKFKYHYSTLCCLALLFSILPGCVRRRLTVRTKPAGAEVYVDSKYLGKSPISSSTLYYGTRQIEVVRDGFRTEKILRKITPPWYQIPPLDFVTETLWPWEIRDERVIDVAMVPQQPTTSDSLNENASQLRLQASQQAVTVAPGSNSGFVLPQGGTAEIPPGAAPSPRFDPAFDTNVPPAQMLNPPPPSVAPANRGGLVTPRTRIPEVGILPGGGYRQVVPDTVNEPPAYGNNLPYPN